MDAYHGAVAQELGQEANDVVDVLVLLHVAQALAPRQLANDVESEELQPAVEVTHLSGRGEEDLRLVQEVVDGGINEGLVRDKGTHGKGTVDATPVLRVPVFILGGKERPNTMASGGGLLDGVEVRLRKCK